MDLKTIGAIAAFLLGSSGLVWKLNDNVKENERVRADAEILNVKTNCKYETDSLRIAIMELRINCSE